jgi:VIT1/CCC1 family predicted Fe2+/Mn2+ transporter
MISLSAKITGLIVTTSMGLFLTAVAILLVIPLIQGIVEGRRPRFPDVPAILENLGVAIAIAGFTFRVTEVSATGVLLMLLGAILGYGKKSDSLHPALRKALLVCGIISVGALGEYYYIVG